MTHRLSKVAGFIFDNSLLLLAGTTTAVVWANVDWPSYDAVAHPLHFWVNDVGMVFFFALAAKEVFEATLPGGALASLRRALSPLAAAVGGMAAPALIYLTLTSTTGPAELARGWAIPCATDVAFSAMVARMIFPPAHPAIPFLLLLAIADDALGLVILAVFYPSGRLSLSAPVALMVTAVLVALWLRGRRTLSFWPYVLGPGTLSWAALYFGGLHPALALVPVVPFMPHGRRDLGLFESSEERRPDTLNRFEHWWATPVQFVLLLFGFANAGVAFEQVGSGTYYVLAGLLLGKPIGILLFSTIARFAGASLPAGLRTGDLLVVGIIASIGFTVSLFFATAAFPAGAPLAETKMGALLSFVAAPLAVLVSRVARGKQTQGADRDRLWRPHNCYSHPAEAAVIEVHSFGYTYPGADRPAVHDVSFSVQQGEIFGFLGPSGAGKSTTQNVLIRLLAGYEGKIRVLNRDLRSWDRGYYRRIGVAFETPNHYLKLTALENLRLFAGLHGGSTEAPEALLRRVGLHEDGNKLVGEFSKGMRGRLTLARALLHRPELIFLDEPTAGLDPVTARRVRQVIRDVRKAGATIFLTTHDMVTADELCDRVAFLVDGSIAALDTPRSLRMSHGRRVVRIEVARGGARTSQEFELEGLADNYAFLRQLRTGGVETIHTLETTLEDVFVRVTGRSLA